MDPARDDYELLTPPQIVWRPRPKFQDRVWLHVVLLILTLGTTTLIGSWYYEGYVYVAGTSLQLTAIGWLVRGSWYSLTVIAILGCHELGHYLACRYYNVDASLPFFLPIPFLPSGTLGAFIRIREPIPFKRMLFDIGIAGPIAGFLIAVPALFIGMSMSSIVPQIDPTRPGTLIFGEPLLYKLASRLMFGSLPHGYDLNLHPIAFAAWFGMLATALNLFPIGQLDGGHISYAVLGRRSSHVTLVGVAIALTLTLFSINWIVWSLLMIVMLRLFGRHHPPVADEQEPLDRGRLLLAGFAVVMFVLCFMPEPLRLVSR